MNLNPVDFEHEKNVCDELELDFKSIQLLSSRIESC